MPNLCSSGTRLFFAGNRQTHEQLEILGAFRLFDDLLQFVLRIEGEALDVVIEVGPANGETRLDRVHEMQPDARNGRRILEFGDGRHVELRNASAVERAEQKDRAVGLIGVGDFTRKILDEPPSSATCRVRTGSEDRAVGLQVRHHLKGSCEFLHRENLSWEAPSELVRGSAGPLPETNQ